MVADVHGDGNAEIIVGANDYCGFGPSRGLFVFGSASDSWASTRAMWNQFNYHITNVNDDGTIPTHEEPSWLAYNSYRQNTQTLPGGPHAAPDLIACYLRSAVAGQTTTLTARIGNGGEILVGPGINVGFYNGDPRAGGTFLGAVQTTKRIVPGDFEDVSLVLMNATIGDVWVVADDGSGPPSMRSGGYEFSSFDVPGATGTAALGLNSTGQVVGLAVIAGGNSAFLLNEGVFETFRVPGTARTEALGVNDLGQIVGTVNFGDYGFLTTIDNFGTTSRFDVPAATSGTIPYGINQTGEIVGQYNTGPGGNDRHGFLRGVDETYTTIDYPGASSTWAFGNNDSGQIVGAYGFGNTILHSWIRDIGGQFTSFDVPLGTATTALDVNDAGQIVGRFNDPSGHTHGFLRDAAGVFTVLDPPGSAYTEIRSINDAGQIVGVWRDPAGILHGFIATPVGTVHECDEANNFYHVPSGLGSAEIHGTVFEDTNGDRSRSWALTDPKILAIGSPLIDPVGIAVSGDGTTLYVSDYGANGVFRVPASGGTPELIGSGERLESVRFLTISPDSSTLYIAGWFKGRILKLPSMGGEPTVLASGSPLLTPHGTAISGDGSTLYIADNFASSVFSLPATGGSPSLLASGGLIDGPLDVAVRSDGTFLYVSTLSHGVVRVPVNGGTPSPFGSAVSLGRSSLTFDEQRALLLAITFAPHYLSDKIYHVPLNGDSPVLLFEGPPFSVGGDIAFSPDRKTLYVADTGFLDRYGIGPHGEAGRVLNFTVASDLGLAGWTILLDENGNGRRDSGEQFEVTDANGNYAFLNLPAGGYTVAEESRPGWIQTAPESGFHKVTLNDGQIVAGIDFGNRQSAGPPPNRVH